MYAFAYKIFLVAIDSKERMGNLAQLVEGEFAEVTESSLNGAIPV